MDEFEQYSGKLIRTLQVRIKDVPGAFAHLARVIGDTGALLGDITRVQITSHDVVRRVQVYVDDAEHLRRMIDGISGLEEVTLVSVEDEVMKIHEGGKLHSTSRVRLDSINSLRMVYTPGVAQVCRAIQDNPALARRYTTLGNSVAVLTNGTAVLGLGDIGVLAGMPVMEGKCVIFDEMAGISATPILVDSHDPKAVIETAALIAPSFGGINLEDIAAPECFEIENALKARLKIPVFHDDQHGTAVVSTAALVSALKTVGRKMEEASVVINGSGAAGIAIAKMLIDFGAGEIILCDRVGAVWAGRSEHMNPYKEEIARLTNPARVRGDLAGVLAGRNVFIGVSGPNLVSPAMVKSMAKGAIVLALANPVPEIAPKAALAAGAAVAADGRSVNNALGFPGIFRGALDSGATAITDGMTKAASLALASLAGEGELLPDFLDRSIHRRVAEAVAQAARADGVAQKITDVTNR